MNNSEQVSELWHEVYDLLRGPGRLQTFLGNSTSHLPQKYDEDLLNDISSLKSLSGNELEDVVARIRTKLGIAQAMGLFSSKDTERVNVLLDKIL